MTIDTDGCIQLAPNAYLTKGTSENLREYLGDDLPQLYGKYEPKSEPVETLFGWTIQYGSWRLVARFDDVYPKEIPLFPDEDGYVFFVIREGGR